MQKVRRMVPGIFNAISHRVGSFSLVVGNGTPTTSHPQASVPCHPPFGSWGRGTLAGERGGGRVPIPTRSYTLWYSLYIYYALCYQPYPIDPSQLITLIPKVTYEKMGALSL
jgi:hypothetical protein